MYFSYCRECLSYEREQLEENSERRLEIFKELINGCAESEAEKSKLEQQPCSEQAGPLVFLSSLFPPPPAKYHFFY